MVAPPTPSLISTTTVVSLTSTLALLLAAYLASTQLLPPRTSSRLRALYIWHLFDALIHLILEASFLYHCFFTYTALPIAAPSGDYPHPASRHGEVPPAFLGRFDRAYGSAYGTNAMARLWQEYARADRRWGGADTTVVGIELVTVLVAGPLAVYVAELVRKGAGGRDAGGQSGKLWFWGSVLAVGELYGGYMTFVPEFLSGSTNLNTTNFMYTWVYLFFFNTLWVWIPLWVLYEAYGDITRAFDLCDRIEGGKKTK